MPDRHAPRPVVRPFVDDDRGLAGAGPQDHRICLTRQLLTCTRTRADYDIVVSRIPKISAELPRPPSIRGGLPTGAFRSPGKGLFDDPDVVRIPRDPRVSDDRIDVVKSQAPRLDPINLYAGKSLSGDESINHRSQRRGRGTVPIPLQRCLTGRRRRKNETLARDADQRADPAFV